ncbi:MAG TPA: hypothetical protein VLB04_11790, partial [Methanotrichaceae archaeon]|nr:hypothetical protein [Methanotrichaceae archaeon]
NMTLSEIGELREQKLQELQNMTLAEIDDLRVQKMHEVENMTLAQLNETRPDRMGLMDHGMMNQDMFGQGRGGYR